MTTNEARTHAENLTETSASQNEIARAEWSNDLHCELRALADDYTETDGGWDYWGTDDAGREWRVELAMPAVDDESDGWQICNRCDHDIEADVVRHYDDGGPDQCSRCGLTFPEIPAEWLEENGYTVDEWDED